MKSPSPVTKPLPDVGASRAVSDSYVEDYSDIGIDEDETGLASKLAHLKVISTLVLSGVPLIYRSSKTRADEASCTLMICVRLSPSLLRLLLNAACQLPADPCQRSCRSLLRPRLVYACLKALD